MAIAVTPTYVDVKQSIAGAFQRAVKFVVTGLTAGAANTIPHGLPGTPQIALYEATSGTPGFETSDPDATNLYFTTGTGQTSLKAYCWY